MGDSKIFTNIRLLLIVCLLCAFLFAALYSFKVEAQTAVSNANNNSSPAASPASSPAVSPTPIPISQIVSEREKTDRRLSEISKIFSERFPVVRLQTEVGESLKDFDERENAANNLIAGNPSLDALGKSEGYWNAISLSLPSKKNRIQSQTVEISAQADELQNLLNIWELTRQSLAAPMTGSAPENAVITANLNTANISISANKISPSGANRNANVNSVSQTNSATAANISNAAANTNNAAPQQLPENVNLQIGELIENIKQTQAVVRFKLGEVIKLQEKVADAEKRTDAMLKKISVTRSALLLNLTVRDAPPIWSGENFASPIERSGENSFNGKFVELKKYFAENTGLFVIHLLIVAVFILLFRRARRKTRQIVKTESKLKDGLLIFEHPFASALILSFFIGPALYYDAPDLLGLFASPILVIAIFFLFRHLIERAYLPILVALVALYLINDVRLLVAPVPILARLVFLLEMIGSIAFLIWLIRGHRPPPDIQYAKTIRRLAFLLIAPFAAAALANVFGYVALANVIGRAIVFSLSLGLILYAVVRVADSLLIFVFRLPPFARLGMVKNHSPLVQKKIFQIIKWSAILVWLIFSLSQAYLTDIFFETLNKILTFEIGTKSFSITLESVLSLFLIIWFSFLLSRFVSFALEQEVYPRVRLTKGLPYAATTILRYLILIGGFFLALAAAGVDLTKFTIFLGALGVGVGIGLQNIVENFTSGLILLLERPVKIGDTIQMSKYQGQLRHIGLRSSTVKTGEGAEVIVPNGQLITEEVTNWTLSDPHRRLDINVGVEYGADPENVIKLLENIGANHPDALPENPARAIFLGFGENSLDFQLRIWTANQDNSVYIKSDIALGVYKALKEAGIEIPFPQRDLHIKSIDDVLSQNINGKL